MTNLILIAAMTKDRVIGKGIDIPWKRIPEDMKRFKDLTMGHPVIMGRKTYNSIPGKSRPLPGRTNIVVSRTTDRGDYPESVVACNSIYLALGEAAQFDEDCYVIGGGQIYEQTIGLASRLEITEVHQKVEGDIFFPEIDRRVWEETSRRDREEYSFVTYGRFKS